MSYRRLYARQHVSEWKKIYIKYAYLKKISKNQKLFEKELVNEVNRVSDFYFHLEKECIFEKKNWIFNEGNLMRKSISETENEDERKSIKFEGKTKFENKKKIENKEIPKNENKGGFFLEFRKKYFERKQERNMMEMIKFAQNVKSFQTVNTIGINELLKKCKNSEVRHNVSHRYILRSKRIDIVLKEIKKMYRKRFSVNKKRVKKIFHKIAHKKRSNPIASFLSGILLTFTLILIKNKLQIETNEIYLGVNYIYLGFALFGFNLVLFNWKDINSEFIFGFELTSNMDTSRYFLFLSIFWFSFNLIAKFLPYYEVIILFQIIIFILPIDSLYSKSRYFLIYTLLKIFSTPIFSVKFRHFFIADCMTSYGSVIYRVSNYYLGTNKSTINYSVLIATIPLFIRFLQCLRRYRDTYKINPHLLNTLKYTMAITNLFIIEFYSSDAKYIFTALYIIYSLYWDFILDWGLQHPNRIFPHFIHIFGVSYDIFGRILPVFDALLPKEYKNNIFIKYLQNSKISIEILRRFIWSLIRVELEHLNNCDKLKNARKITISNPELFYKKDIPDYEQTTTAYDESECKEDVGVLI